MFLIIPVTEGTFIVLLNETRQSDVVVYVCKFQTFKNDSALNLILNLLGD